MLILLMILNSFVSYGQFEGSEKNEDLEQLKETIAKDTRTALLWQNGWLAGYSAATLGQGVIFFISDSRTTRQDMALGAATTFLGAMGQIVMPVVPPDLKCSIDEITAVTGGNLKDSVQLYQSILREIAQKEKEGRSWKNHALTGAVNVTSGLITWLGFKRTAWDGFINFALNTAITEAQIWTQPLSALHDYNRYFGNPEADQILKTRNTAEWLLSCYPGGITLSVHF